MLHTVQVGLRYKLVLVLKSEGGSPTTIYMSASAVSNCTKLCMIFKAYREIAAFVNSIQAKRARINFFSEEKHVWDKLTSYNFFFFKFFFNAVHPRI